MKIALIIERMDTFRGGRERSLAQIAVELTRREHEVSIICQKASWSHDGVKIRQLGSKGLFRAEQLRNFITQTQRTIKEETYDIIHSTLPLPGADIYQPRGGTVPAQVAGRLRRGSAIRKFRVLLDEQLKVRRQIMRKLERQVANDPRVMCLPGSRLVAEEFNRYYQRQTGVKVIYNGVDTPDAECPERAQWRREKREQLKIGPDDFVLLSVANNFALKGVSETIRAFAKWYHHGGKPQAYLIVVGDDKPWAYRRLAEKKGVGGQVIFAGATDEIFQWYAAADACILLSWYDPCSRVVLEATCWGIPSITTVYNGASEILDEGGIVVNSPTDCRAVVAAMDSLCDAGRRGELSQNCLQIVEKLSMERHVDE
ncbi:MAG: glycosyltransferase, partial [Actinobacteria bacterium]|nr:glycosyltransferase [Actinomycetota bacterium]